MIRRKLMLERLEVRLALDAAASDSPNSQDSALPSMDFDGDGMVADTDVGLILAEVNQVTEGSTPHPDRVAVFDTNRDGYVSPIDVLRVINERTRQQWNSVFQSVRVDAIEYVAAASNDLILSEEAVTRVQNDLALLVSKFPELAGFHVKGNQRNGPFQLYLTVAGRDAYRRGELTQLDELNQKYGATSVVLNEDIPWLPTLTIEFDNLYNLKMLVAEYSAIEGVLEVVSGYIHIGEPGESLLPGPLQTNSSEPRTYTFELGWGDCPAGCIGDYSFTLKVINGTVIGEPPKYHRANDSVYFDLGQFDSFELMGPLQM